MMRAENQTKMHMHARIVSNYSTGYKKSLSYPKTVRVMAGEKLALSVFSRNPIATRGEVTL